MINIDNLKFDEKGLIPAVVTESDTGNNDNSGGESSVPTPSQGQTEDASVDE